MKCQVTLVQYFWSFHSVIKDVWVYFTGTALWPLPLFSLGTAEKSLVCLISSSFSSSILTDKSLLHTEVLALSVFTVMIHTLHTQSFLWLLAVLTVVGRFTHLSLLWIHIISQSAYCPPGHPEHFLLSWIFLGKFLSMYTLCWTPRK